MKNNVYTNNKKKRQKLNNWLHNLFFILLTYPPKVMDSISVQLEKPCHPPYRLPQHHASHSLPGKRVSWAIVKMVDCRHSAKLWNWLSLSDLFHSSTWIFPVIAIRILYSIVRQVLRVLRYLAVNWRRGLVGYGYGCQTVRESPIMKLMEVRGIRSFEKRKRNQKTAI